MQKSAQLRRRKEEFNTAKGVKVEIGKEKGLETEVRLSYQSLMYYGLLRSGTGPGKKPPGLRAKTNGGRGEKIKWSKSYREKKPSDRKINRKMKVSVKGIVANRKKDRSG